MKAKVSPKLSFFQLPIGDQLLSTRRHLAELGGDHGFFGRAGFLELGLELRQFGTTLPSLLDLFLAFATTHNDLPHRV